MSRGLGSGLNISSIKATARLPTRRCILSLELGCNPVVPLLGFHEALAGPADGMCKPTALHATNGPNGSGSTPFFRIPEANKQLYGPIDMTKREQIVYFQLRMNLFSSFDLCVSRLFCKSTKSRSCMNSI
jgi:hypothetical protein